MTVSIDPTDPMQQARDAFDELQKLQDKAKADHEVYLAKIAQISSLKGDQLAIALLFSIMANYPTQSTPDATMTGYYEDKINVTGDGMKLMAKLTSFVNGMENQFSSGTGTTKDLESFAKSADAFLAATAPGGWLTQGGAIPPATLDAARGSIQKMRDQIYIKGVDDPSKQAACPLSDDDSKDPKHEKASYSFAELSTNAQLPDGLGPNARSAVKLFTQGFDSVSSVFDGANSSLKLSLDQDTNDSKNMTSAMVTIGQDFFKPSDIAVNNSRPS